MKSEDLAKYIVDKPTDNEAQILNAAAAILRGRMCALNARNPITSPTAVKEYLKYSIADLEHEEFGVLWLDARGRLIEDCRMFSGTLTQTSVYPREVVKSALKHNAAAAIFYHNHPSGSDQPSEADKNLTHILKTVLASIDVTVRDHIIVACDRTFSFAENGMI